MQDGDRTQSPNLTPPLQSESKKIQIKNKNKALHVNQINKDCKS